MTGNRFGGQTNYYSSGPPQSSGPYQVLLNEFANHPGTLDAARSLVTFAENNCGITSMDDPNSVYGGTQTDPGIPFNHEPNYPSQRNPYPAPSQPQTSLVPPETAVPSTTPGAPAN